MIFLVIGELGFAALASFEVLDRSQLRSRPMTRAKEAMRIREDILGNGRRGNPIAREKLWGLLRIAEIEQEFAFCNGGDLGI